MFAVIKTGGKQYLVRKDDVLRLEKIDKKEGSAVNFDKVLLYSDSQKTEIGKPFLKGRKAAAKILAQIKGEKIDVIKYRSKTRYRRKIGHRQFLSVVKIMAIE